MFHVKHLRPNRALSRNPIIAGVERESRGDFLDHHKVVRGSHEASEPEAQLFQAGLIPARLAIGVRRLRNNNEPTYRNITNCAFRRCRGGAEGSHYQKFETTIEVRFAGELLGTAASYRDVLGCVWILQVLF
jgi:hypothetical protein